jgi:hypothetical protein
MLFLAAFENLIGLSSSLKPRRKKERVLDLRPFTAIDSHCAEAKDAPMFDKQSLAGWPLILIFE